MKQPSKNTLGISELINRIKSDLLVEQSKSEPKLFSIDEISIELNFVIDGNIESGFNLGIVTLGSQVSEERVQKIIVKMTPIASKKQLIDDLNHNPQESSEVLDTSSKVLFRGDPPKR